MELLPSISMELVPCHNIGTRTRSDVTCGQGFDQLRGQVQKVEIEVGTEVTKIIRQTHNLGHQFKHSPFSTLAMLSACILS